MTIKVARSSQSEQQCVDNTLAAIKAAVEKMPRKWEGVQVRRTQNMKGMHKRRAGAGLGLLCRPPVVSAGPAVVCCLQAKLPFNI